MRFFINFSYKGTNYHGWQSQSNSNSIQEEMERAMSTLLIFPIKLIASGRTDSGVHATNQIIHFDSKSKRSTDSWVRGANTYLSLNDF